MRVGEFIHSSFIIHSKDITEHLLCARQFQVLGPSRGHVRGSPYFAGAHGLVGETETQNFKQE